MIATAVAAAEYASTAYGLSSGAMDVLYRRDHEDELMQQVFLALKQVDHAVKKADEHGVAKVDIALLVQASNGTLKADLELTGENTFES